MLWHTKRFDCFEGTLKRVTENETPDTGLAREEATKVWALSESTYQESRSDFELLKNRVAHAPCTNICVIFSTN